MHASLAAATARSPARDGASDHFSRNGRPPRLRSAVDAAFERFSPVSVSVPVHRASADRMP